MAATLIIAPAHFRGYTNGQMQVMDGVYMAAVDKTPSGSFAEVTELNSAIAKAEAEGLALHITTDTACRVFVGADATGAVGWQVLANTDFTRAVFKNQKVFIK